MEGRRQPVTRRNISPPSAAAVTPPSAAAVSTEETDVEKQTHELTRKGIQVDKKSTWVLIVNGYHVFCAAPLYSTPYALMEGGWFGIVLLFVYWSCALYTSLELGMCMNEYDALVFTYQEVGEHAFGRTGHFIVSVNEHLVVLAGCVESVTIIFQAVVYALPGFIAFLDQQSNWTILIGAIVMIIPLTLVCELVDVAEYDRWLTVSGTVLNFLVVACLVWLRYVNGVTESTSTTEYVKVSSLPTSSGLFGYCFAGHPYLPILYGSIMTDNKDLTYIKIVYAFFLPSLLTYLLAATLGYSMFGANVESVYILNMPLDYRASQVAVFVMGVHQCIRFLLGVQAMEESMHNRLRQNISGDLQDYTSSILKGITVTIIVPLSILIPAYGPLMAFLGSLLGIVVSLLIPCVFSLKIRWIRMKVAEMLILIMIILLGTFAAIAGMVSSFPQMLEMQWSFSKFSQRS